MARCSPSLCLPCDARVSIQLPLVWIPLFVLAAEWMCRGRGACMAAVRSRVGNLPRSARACGSVAPVSPSLPRARALAQPRTASARAGNCQSPPCWCSLERTALCRRILCAASWPARQSTCACWSIPTSTTATSSSGRAGRTKSCARTETSCSMPRRNHGALRRWLRVPIRPRRRRAQQLPTRRARRGAQLRRELAGDHAITGVTVTCRRRNRRWRFATQRSRRRALRYKLALLVVFAAAAGAPTRRRSAGRAGPCDLRAWFRGRPT